jgi:ribosome biogenesis GTPase
VTVEETFEARVIATFGRHMRVRDSAGREHQARPSRRSVAVVCGDRVLCDVDAHHDEVYVREFLPRRSALYRSNARGGAELVVANLTRLLVVLAPVPQPDLFVLDRYLAAATSADVAATVVVNKAELGITEELQRELEAYSAAGYAFTTCSARSGEGVAALVTQVAGGIGALVGQSGVGKSSLVRRLIPEAEVQIGELMREGEGRHTTTASRLFDLPRGGHLIDSPGVRDFAPSIQHLDSRTVGFPEVERLAPGCRFSDCRHMKEPGCAVRSAAENGGMPARRYESYRRLRRLYEDLMSLTAPGAGGGRPERRY